MLDNDLVRTFVAAFVSIASYAAGETITILNNLGVQFNILMIQEGVVDILLQRGARTVAILAGIMAVINGCRNWNKRKDKEKTKT